MDPSPAVVEFIDKHIGSIGHLETLLLLKRSRDERFTAERVGAELRTSAAPSAERLEDLTAAGVLEVQPGPPADYRYAPASGELDAVVDALEQLYAQKRYTIIDLIFARPPKNVKVFADAFRIRRPPKGDK